MVAGRPGREAGGRAGVPASTAAKQAMCKVWQSATAHQTLRQLASAASLPSRPWLLQGQGRGRSSGREWQGLQAAGQARTEGHGTSTCWAVCCDEGGVAPRREPRHSAAPPGAPGLVAAAALPLPADAATCPCCLPPPAAAVLLPAPAFFFRKRSSVPCLALLAVAAAGGSPSSLSSPARSLQAGPGSMAGRHGWQARRAASPGGVP